MLFNPPDIGQIGRKNVGCKMECVWVTEFYSSRHSHTCMLPGAAAILYISWYIFQWLTQCQEHGQHLLNISSASFSWEYVPCQHLFIYPTMMSTVLGSMVNALWLSGLKLITAGNHDLQKCLSPGRRFANLFNRVSTVLVITCLRIRWAVMTSSDKTG